MTRITDHAKCDRGPGSHNWLWRVSLLVDVVQLAGCLRKPEDIPLEWDVGIQ